MTFRFASITPVRNSIEEEVALADRAQAQDEPLVAWTETRMVRRRDERRVAVGSRLERIFVGGVGTDQLPAHLTDVGRKGPGGHLIRGGACCR